MTNDNFKLIIILVIILLFGGCNSKEKISKTYFPTNVTISTKFILTNYAICYQDKIRPFCKMKENDCMFTLDEETYSIRSKYILDKDGKINSYWSYLTEGPDIHSFEALEQDPIFFESIGGKDLSVKLVGDIIIDGKDSLKVEKVWVEEQLISVEAKPSKTVIYQYK